MQMKKMCLCQNGSANADDFFYIICVRMMVQMQVKKMCLCEMVVQMQVKKMCVKMVVQMLMKKMCLCENGGANANEENVFV